MIKDKIVLICNIISFYLFWYGAGHCPSQYWIIIFSCPSQNHLNGFSLNVKTVLWQEKMDKSILKCQKNYFFICQNYPWHFIFTILSFGFGDKKTNCYFYLILNFPRCVSFLEVNPGETGNASENNERQSCMHQ